MGKDILYIFLLCIPSEARKEPLGFILSLASKYLKTWLQKTLVTLDPEKKMVPLSRRDSHLWDSPFSCILGFPRRFPHHPKTNEV